MWAGPGVDGRWVFPALQQLQFPRGHPSFFHSINVYIEHLLGARHSLTLLLANSIDCGQVADLCGPRSPLFVFLSFVFFWSLLFKLGIMTVPHSAISSVKECAGRSWHTGPLLPTAGIM